MTQPNTLKEINIIKKRLSWGEIPPFYHMISNAVADLEGIHTHGFDHPLKRLIDRQNWNLDRLDGIESAMGKITVQRKPRITLFSGFQEKSFEVHCAPISQGGPVFVYANGDPFIDFKVWDPGTMRCLFRLPHFKEFIAHAFAKGDEADQLLVNYTAQLVDELLDKLAIDIDIEERKGQSLPQIINEIQQSLTPNQK